MNKRSSIFKLALASSLFAASASAFAAYDSGSTGADGIFNPATSQSIQLPPDGKFNYISVNIPSGVVITYLKNAANTPVTILSQGDVTIAGTINVSATNVDMVSGGVAGPGGYDGGAGGAGAAIGYWVNGYTGPNVGRAGLGPGGGAPGAVHKPTSYSGYAGYADVSAGGGGAYGVAPPAAGGQCPTTPGVTYGNAMILPLIGGSGGGGGAGGISSSGSGGGGGGGAILIASSGTINVAATGSILANGGSSLSPGAYSASYLTRGAYGGGGSGGAIHLIATTVSGNGTISAAGGASSTEFAYSNYASYVICSTSANLSNYGGAGRIRIDTDNLIRTVDTTPTYTKGTTNTASVSNIPTITITSIGGVAVPAGNSSITLSTFTNPVTVNFVTTGVIVGNAIKLTVTPAQGLATSVTSAATTGTIDNATASVSVNLLPGSNTLQASVTYTLVASAGDAMSVYAQGERVEKVTLASTLGSKESKVTLTTVSGKEYLVPASVLARIPS